MGRGRMTGPVIYGKQTSSSGQELNEGNVNVNLNVENGKQCMGAGEATSLVAFRKESKFSSKKEWPFFLSKKELIFNLWC